MATTANQSSSMSSSHAFLVQKPSNEKLQSCGIAKLPPNTLFPVTKPGKPWRVYPDHVRRAVFSSGHGMAMDRHSSMINDDTGSQTASECTPDDSTDIAHTAGPAHTALPSRTACEQVLDDDAEHATSIFPEDVTEGSAHYAAHAVSEDLSDGAASCPPQTPPKYSVCPVIQHAAVRAAPTATEARPAGRRSRMLQKWRSCLPTTSGWIEKCRSVFRPKKAARQQQPPGQWECPGFPRCPTIAPPHVGSVEISPRNDGIFVRKLRIISGGLKSQTGSKGTNEDSASGTAATLPEDIRNGAVSRAAQCSPEVALDSAAAHGEDAVCKAVPNDAAAHAARNASHSTSDPASDHASDHVAHHGSGHASHNDANGNAPDDSGSKLVGCCSNSRETMPSDNILHPAAAPTAAKGKAWKRRMVQMWRSCLPNGRRGKHPRARHQ